MSMLKAQGLTKTFGGFTAVDDVTLSVEERAVHSVIGANGAGKTTLFNMLSGGLTPTHGTVEVAGEEVTRHVPEAFVRRGLVRTFQITSVFGELTVHENVAIGVRATLGRSLSIRRGQTDDEAVRAGVRGALAEVRLEHRAQDRADELSHGEKRALELAIALGRQPRILLLDEPMAGVSAADRDVLRDLIVKVRDDLGVTVVLVEHDVEMVLAISDRISVLHQGRLIAEGSAAEIQSDAAVRSAYLGESA